MTARSAAPAATGVRFGVLASYEFWRRSWWVLAYGILVMLVGEGITFFGHHGIDPSFLLVMFLFVALLVVMDLRQRWHYVELGPEGLVIRRWFRLTEVPYSVLRQSRAQPLRAFFDTPARRQLLTGNLRRYGSSPVCVVRVEVERDQLLEIGRQLGRRTVLDQDLILLVRRAEELDQALHARIRRRPPAPASRASRRR